ncbi:uncharacterized protein LOC62_01G000667 [Vanrija pseudolonga]|uniref:Uncharacterized protein n=1 Tax=Vanrija pseudolonga TaxID=143232 RepID=A0AAF0Y3S0_9TREE|nr:hypothetical protein LOC62_01G000667 [Vanrija pseudolonga]
MSSTNTTIPSSSSTALPNATTTAGGANSTTPAVNFPLTITADTSVKQCGYLDFRWTGSAPPFTFYLLNSSHIEASLNFTSGRVNSSSWIRARYPPATNVNLVVVDAQNARATSNPVHILEGTDACMPSSYQSRPAARGPSAGTIAGAVFAGVFLLCIFYCVCRRRVVAARYAHAENARRAARAAEVPTTDPEIIRLNSRARERERERDQEENVALMSAAAAPARPAPPRRLTGEPDPDDVAPPYSPADATKYPPPPIYQGMGAAAMSVRRPVYGRTTVILKLQGSRAAKKAVSTAPT